MMRHILISFVVLLLHALPVQAQNLLQRKLNNDTMPNLVPNPGFELTKKIQCAWTQKARKFNEEVMIGWNSPTETTPDHFTTKADADCWSNPAKKSKGRASPRTGDCMAGIKSYGKGNTPTYWHEYLQIELPEPLTAGKHYVAEFFALHAVFSNLASNNLGMYLSGVPVRSRDCLPLYYPAQVREEDVIEGGWHKVSGVIEAKGDERYIIIGNFCTDQLTRNKKMPEGERGAYYFIDDVNVRLAPANMKVSDPPMVCIPPPPKQRVADHASTAEVALVEMEPEVGKHIRLDKIFFDFDKSTLKTESELELTTVVDLLTDYPFMRIAIEAHTDDQGTDDYNQKLSDARAKAVADWLITKKIDTERIEWKGYGESKPLAEGTTETERAINRRVEFRVLDR
ncbi:MAG: OmpA family protein [Flavobacteriales bacterium]|nr:OmpA family protein [Flavobacteriales bacterium]